MTTHDRHDLIELRRTLREIGGSAPEFDAGAVLARTTDEDGEPQVDEFTRQRRSRDRRRVGPWATGAVAAGLLASVVLPAALNDGPLVAADRAGASATAAVSSRPADVTPPAVAGPASGGTMPAETAATPQPTPQPLGRPWGRTGRPLPHTVPPAIPPTPAFPPDSRLGQPPIPMPLPTAAAGPSSREARLEGRPVLRSWGCVVVQSTDGQRRPVVWPHGFTTGRQGQDLVILDAEGGRVGVIGTDGRPGTLLEFSGGFADVTGVGSCGDARGDAFLIGAVAPTG